MRKLITLLLLFIGLQTFAVNYYVDPSSTGTNAGTLANPWKSLADISWTNIVAGDAILFKRGQKFQGTLTIGKSGTASARITLGAYGSGANPLFWGTGATISQVFNVNNRNYITFQDLTISDTTISISDRTVQSKIQRGWSGGGSYMLIKRCVIDRVGVGVYWTGQYNVADSCDFGNLRMVRNTNDGPPPGNDDDYGANPFVISGSNNSVTSNYMHDCWAASYDYLVDGGGVDIYADANGDITNTFIAYNTMVDCNGVIEIGGSGGKTVSNTILAYNKLINNGSISYVSNSGTYLTYVNDLQFYNNVIVETEPYRLISQALFAFKTAPTTASSLVLKNNIIQLYGTIDVCRAQWGTAGALVHENNIYNLGSGSVLNFTRNPSELQYALNVNIWQSTTGNPLTWNYSPLPTGPAIEFGQNIPGLTRDFAGNPINAKPEAGILEYGVITPPQPTQRTFIIRSSYGQLIVKPGN